MNKGGEVSKPLMIGIIVVVVAIVGFFAMKTFAPSTPVVDTTTISTERLRDPDRGPSTRNESPETP